MKWNKVQFYVLFIVVLMLSLAVPATSQAASATNIAPTSITDTRGKTVGSVSALATKDQSGNQNTASAYVAMTTPNGSYIGQYAYKLPASMSAASVQSIQLQVNFRGPKRSAQQWTWQLYDWKGQRWVKTGDNTASDGTNWALMTFTVPASRTARYINASGKINVRVQSANRNYDGALDYMVVQIAATPVAQPPANEPPPTTPPTPEPPVPPQTGQPVPVAVAGNWRPIWADEFNGTSLDLTKWEPGWFYKSGNPYTQFVNSDEGQCFSSNNIRMPGDGSVYLDLKAGTCPSTAGKSAGLPYIGAAITTRPHFTFTYGVVETRMWVNGKDATHCNNWDSFWLNGLDSSTRKEYDVAECLGNTFAFHLNPGSTMGGSNKSTPISNGWHTFTVDWEPTGATVYYDTVKIGAITTTPYTAPMYIMYENATHGTTNVVAPDVMRIDYVRVWQK